MSGQREGWWVCVVWGWLAWYLQTVVWGQEKGEFVLTSSHPDLEEVYQTGVALLF